jgi:hypothetical protein
MSNPTQLPPAPSALHAQTGETYITLSLPNPPKGVTSIRLYVREFPKDWETAKILDFPVQRTISNTDDESGKVSVQTAKVTGLFPTSTVECRMAYQFESGELSECGPATSVDTLAAGCTPSSESDEQTRKNKKKCTIS